MEASADEGWLFDRGVWRAPYLVDGARVLIAVDSHGIVRKHLKLRAGVDPIRAADWLHELLDRIDPPRKIALVRDGPRKRAERAVDPAVLNDPRSPHGKRRYWAQLTRAATSKIPRTSDI